MTNVLKNLRSIIYRQLLSTNCEEYKMALIVRTDISMGKGKAAAQCAHAAIECYRQGLAGAKHRDLLRAWEASGQPKIVLKISSQTELDELAKTARSNGVITATIRDAGRTQLAPGTVSVLGLGPASRSNIQMLTSHLKLLWRIAIV